MIVLTDGGHGDLLWRSTSAVDGLDCISTVAAGAVLVSGGVGVAPAWSASPTLASVTLADTTTAITGVLFKGADRFVHNFHHPTGGSAVPTGDNVFVGQRAGNFTIGSTASSVSHGSYNSVLGVNAFQSATTGYNNVAVGFQALQLLTTGWQNVAVGVNALSRVTTAHANVAIGFQAGLLSTIADGIVAVGQGALEQNTTGSVNTGIGLYALQYTTAGNYNTGIGGEALQYNTTGGNNVAIGWGAGGSDESASIDNRSMTDTCMTFLGTDACRDASVANSTTLTNATAIGYGARVLASNQVSLGNTSVTSVRVPASQDGNLTVTLGSGGSAPTGYRTNVVRLCSPSSGSFPGQAVLQLELGNSPIWYAGVDSDGAAGAKTSTLDFGFYSYEAANYTFALRSAGGVVNSHFYEGIEMTAPAAPGANRGRLYFEDDGAGKTRLMVKFATGAAQPIAMQP